MQHILITGGNAGIGKTTAIALAKKGAKIIIACRNAGKAKQAVDDIKASSNKQEIYSLQCDLANLKSIEECVQAYKTQFGQLDVLINNAGLITDKLQLTSDGFEMQIGVNHLGHFSLTTQLLDLLEKSDQARIINVSSKAHYDGKIHFGSFKGELGAEKYKGMAAYAQSKLANILFTKELAKRYPSICSHCLHPGVVGTSIAGKNGNKASWRIMWKLFSPIMLSPSKGARTSVYLATSPDVLETNGNYYDKQKAVKPSDLAQDEKLASELWELSETLVDRVSSETNKGIT